MRGEGRGLCWGEGERILRRGGRERALLGGRGGRGGGSERISDFPDSTHVARAEDPL